MEDDGVASLLLQAAQYSHTPVHGHGPDHGRDGGGDDRAGRHSSSGGGGGDEGLHGFSHVLDGVAQQERLVSSLQAKVRLLARQLEASQAEGEASLRRYIAERKRTIAAAAARERGLEAAVKAARSDAEVSAASLREQRQATAALARRLDATDADLAAARAECDLLRPLAARLQADLRAAIAARAEVANDRDAVEAARSATAMALATREAEVESLRREAGEAAAAQAAMRQESAGLAERLSTARRNLALFDRAMTLQDRVCAAFATACGKLEAMVLQQGQVLRRIVAHEASPATAATLMFPAFADEDGQGRAGVAGAAGAGDAGVGDARHGVHYGGSDATGYGRALTAVLQPETARLLPARVMAGVASASASATASTVAAGGASTGAGAGAGASARATDAKVGTDADADADADEAETAATREAVVGLLLTSPLPAASTRSLQARVDALNRAAADLADADGGVPALDRRYGASVAQLEAAVAAELTRHRHVTSLMEGRRGPGDGDGDGDGDDDGDDFWNGFGSARVGQLLRASRSASGRGGSSGSGASESERLGDMLVALLRARTRHSLSAYRGVVQAREVDASREAEAAAAAALRSQTESNARAERDARMAAIEARVRAAVTDLGSGHEHLSELRRSTADSGAAAAAVPAAAPAASAAAAADGVGVRLGPDHLHTHGYEHGHGHAHESGYGYGHAHGRTAASPSRVEHSDGGHGYWPGVGPSGGGSGGDYSVGGVAAVSGVFARDISHTSGDGAGGARGDRGGGGGGFGFVSSDPGLLFAQPHPQPQLHPQPQHAGAWSRSPVVHGRTTFVDHGSGMGSVMGVARGAGHGSDARASAPAYAATPTLRWPSHPQPGPFGEA